MSRNGSSGRNNSDDVGSTSQTISDHKPQNSPPQVPGQSGQLAISPHSNSSPFQKKRSRNRWSKGRKCYGSSPRQNRGQDLPNPVAQEEPQGAEPRARRQLRYPLKAETLPERPTDDGPKSGLNQNEGEDAAGCSELKESNNNVQPKSSKPGHHRTNGDGDSHAIGTEHKWQPKNRKNNGAYSSQQNPEWQHRNRYSTHWDHSYHNYNHLPLLPVLPPLPTYVIVPGYPLVRVKTFVASPVRVAPLPLLPYPCMERPTPVVLMRLLKSLDVVITTEQKPPHLKNGSCWDQLSSDVWSTYLINQQSEDVLCKKIEAWGIFYDEVKDEFSRHNVVLPHSSSTPSELEGLGLYLVGSSFTGFGMESSDVDISMMLTDAEIPRSHELGFLNALRIRFFSQLGAHYPLPLVDPRTVEVVEAKVAILRFMDREHVLQFDISCNQPVGIRNTHLLFHYGKCDWRVRPLVVLVKAWAKFHSINDARDLTLSSYSLTLMVIHFLQSGVQPKVLPCLQKESDRFAQNQPLHLLSVLNFPFDSIETFQSQNDQSLGELLLGFFEYYSSFDYDRLAVSVRSGSTKCINKCKYKTGPEAPKNDPGQWKYICIEEPFERTNTARSVFDLSKFRYILEVFQHSAYALSESHRLESIFSPVDLSHAYVP